MKRLTAGRCVEMVILNGGPAALIRTESGAVVGAVFIEPGDGDRAALIRWVRNPTKLHQLR